MQDKLYEFIMKVQSISKIGMLFSKDPYAIENYEELQKLSKELIEHFGEYQLNRENFFARDIYPTPNISVRTIIFNEKNQLLLVKEKAFGTWSLPGGWCDLFATAQENAIREVKEEAGKEIIIDKILGITSREPYLDNKSLCEYTIVFEAKITKDLNNFCHEISDVGFFDLNKLPEISHKYTLKEIQRILENRKQNRVVFD
ncbi:MAG: NUDIX hydrolase N-terminal domain-containing protein [Bacilli bacterium]|nr:NUDIX hydrolase N-terminal domain-containing protein [Bacilli bacterium]MDD4584794.1 NUDIX hydrolase N-terminal domain-containing protein [Bacilli bacterium]